MTFHARVRAEAMRGKSQDQKRRSQQWHPTLRVLPEREFHIFGHDSPLWTVQGAVRHALSGGLERLGFGFADAFEDDVWEVGFAADAGGVPDKLAFFFGGVAPGGLTFCKTPLDDAFRFAEHDRDVFVRMEAVADEEGDNDDVAGGSHGVAIADAGGFFHEYGMDFGVNAADPDEIGLALDGF